MPYRDNRTVEVHRYICQYWQTHGFTPSLRQIAEGVGFNSNGGVLRHLDKLEKWGWIERHHGQPRALTILKMCDACDLIPSESIPCLSPPSSRRQ